MPTNKQITEAQQKLKELIKPLAEINADTLEKPDLGPLSFKGGVPLFHRVLNLYRSLSECNLDDISLAKTNELIEVATATTNALNEIGRFSLETQPNAPQATRDALIQGFLERWEREYLVVTPVIAYAVRRGTDFNKLEREARGTLVELQSSREKLNDNIRDMTGQMQAALLQVQDACRR